ncbi:hypothetical protein KEM54_001200, partial [Ascosphaera aggregata]
MYAASSSTDPSHPYAVLQGNPEVASRDRYSNVVPFANSRIKLKVPEGQCDYINASPITLKDEDSTNTYKFIAAQGPKQDGIHDFWQMVFQETGPVAVVVMLTSIFENGREKCAQYFPVDPRQSTMELRSSSRQQDPFIDHWTAAMARSYRADRGSQLNETANDNYNEPDKPQGTISLLDTEWCEAAHSIIRKFQLTFSNASKTVYHYHFQNWPDHGHPQSHDRDAIVALSRMTAERAGTPLNPRIVHCSAGVGRTGTFIALDHLLRALRSGALLRTNKRNQSERQEINAHVVLSDQEPRKRDIIFNTVDRLRRQRMYMVFTGVQYRFIHQVLREQALSMIGAVEGSKRMDSSNASRSGRASRSSSNSSSSHNNANNTSTNNGNIDMDIANQADPYARVWKRAKTAQPANPKIIRRAGSTILVTTDAQGHVTEHTTTDRISAEKAATTRACVASVPDMRARDAGGCGSTARSKSRSSDDADSSDTSSLRARRLKKMPKLAGVMPPRLSFSSDSDHSQDSSTASISSGNHDHHKVEHENIDERQPSLTYSEQANSVSAGSSNT